MNCALAFWRVYQLFLDVQCVSFLLHCAHLNVAVCCSVLQCLAVCCSVLQGVAVCYTVLQ